MMMLPITLLTSVHALCSMPSVSTMGISDESLNVLPYHARAAADDEDEDEEYDDEDDDDFDDDEDDDEEEEDEDEE